MDDCIFCKIIKGDIPSSKVYEDEHTYAFLDINPVSEYHTLVIPKKHCVNIFDIGEDEIAHAARTVRKLAGLYSEKLGINNAQIICSSGREAQQDVMHLHFHIVPRASGDGNNIQWKTHPEWRDGFDKLLERIAI